MHPNRLKPHLRSPRLWPRQALTILPICYFVASGFAAILRAPKWELGCARANSSNAKLIVHQCKAIDCLKEACSSLSADQYNFLATTNGTIEKVLSRNKGSAGLVIRGHTKDASKILDSVLDLANCAQQLGYLAPNWTLHLNHHHHYVNGSYALELYQGYNSRFVGSTNVCNRTIPQTPESQRRRTPRQVALDTFAASGDGQVEEEELRKFISAARGERASARVGNLKKSDVTKTDTGRQQQANKERQLVLVRVDQQRPMVYVLGKGPLGRPALLLDLGQNSPTTTSSTSGTNSNNSKRGSNGSQTAQEDSGREQDRGGSAGSGGQSSGGRGYKGGGNDSGGSGNSEDSTDHSAKANNAESSSATWRAVSLFERLLDLTFFNITLFS